MALRRAEDMTGVRTQVWSENFVSERNGIQKPETELYYPGTEYDGKLSL
jgi:hypothetical protein